MRTFIEYHNWIGVVLVVLEYEGDNLRITNEEKETKELHFLNENNTEFRIHLDCSVRIAQQVLRKSGSLYSIRFSTVKLDRRGDKSSNHVMESLLAKWMKRDLANNEFSFNCDGCSSTIISSNSCKSMHDMPSEFWAEFMDYWHCHKPLSDKKDGIPFRYNNPLIPHNQELLLGDSFILLNKDAVVEQLDLTDFTVTCRKCNKPLGSETKDGVVKINKWCLKAEINGQISTFSLVDYVLCQLFNDLKSNSTRLFQLKEGAKLLTVWIFGFGSNIAFNDDEIQGNCLKILYQEGIVEDKSGNQNTEVITLNEHGALDSFLVLLQSVNSKLPNQLQSMKEWKVSYVSCG